MAGNPRKANGARRRGVLAWVRSLGAPCWICGLPIDYGLSQGDPLSCECDEIVPVSRGGSPYDRDNVAAAHRCCNNWRGNKPARRVEAVRGMVAAAFGPCSSPLEFVARAKTVERNPAAGRGSDLPRTTTDW